MWRRPGGTWRRKTRTFLTNKHEEEPMHVGTQQFNTPDEDLEILVRHGVFNKNEDYISIQLDSGEI